MSDEQTDPVPPAKDIVNDALDVLTEDEWQDIYMGKRTVGDVVVEALTKANLLLPSEHPLTHGEYYRWHFEGGHINETSQCPPLYSWEPTKEHHHVKVTHVERVRLHGVNWADEPEVMPEEEAKAKAMAPQWPWHPDAQSQA